jgi:hypothetical protein
VRAVLLFRQSPPSRLAGLPAPSLLLLARVLRDAGRADDALQVYGLLAEQSPPPAGLAEAALEAARFAAARRRAADAQRILRLALAGGLSPEERAQAEQMLAALAPTPERPRVDAAPVAEVVPVAARPAPPARPARRSLGELLAAFMEEKNILWGELVGGLLIVGGSIALVISLWNTLQENPYFPFGIFAAVTAALFGAGLYTLHHWKLESTSRGLLVIATLLVPLCFTVLPSMLQEEAGDTLELLIAAGGLLAFAALIHQAGRVLVPGAGWLLTVGVLGCSVSQLLGARLLGAGPTRPGLVLLLGCLPAACGALSVGVAVRRFGRGPAEAGAARSLLALLGLAGFALALALGVFVFRAGDVALALRHLALPVAAAAVPALAAGLALHAGLAPQPRLAGLRTAGTAVALAAVAVMLLAVALAWPLVWILLAVCALNFVVLTYAALRGGLPVAHAAALPCLALGFLLAFHLPAGAGAASGEALLAELLSARAGTRLAAVVLACAAAGELLARRDRRDHALAYAAGGGLVALVSLALVTWHGLDGPGAAAAVYGIYAAATAAVNLRWRRAWLTYVALGLACAGTLWGLHAGWPGRLPLWSAVLAAEALAFAVLLLDLPASLAPAFRRPLAHGAEAVGWLAAVLGVAAGIGEPWRPEYAVTAVCLLGLHLMLALLGRRVAAARVAGVMLLGTVVATAGWAGTAAGTGDLGALLGLCLALTSTFLALVSVWGARGGASEGPLAHFAPARREVTAVAAVLAVLLAAAFADPGTALHTGTAFGLAATAWLLTWRYRSAVLAWVGSTFLLVGLAHLLTWAAELTSPRTAAVALLLHATILLGPVLLLRGGRRPFAVTLGRAALVSTFLALPVLVLLDGGSLDARAALTGWLSAVWMVLAWAERRRWLFACFQAALCLTTVYALTAWLEGQPWVVDDPEAGLWGPRSLQVYGLGLAGLCLLGALARIVLRRNGTALVLLLADWPGVDRFVLGALLLGQMGLADWGVARGVLVELTPADQAAPLDAWPAPAVVADAYGPGAWQLLGVLALVLGVSLWQPPPGRRQGEAVLGLAVLAMTVPVLWAWPFAAEAATASALRWGLTAAFLACSLLLWLRGPLAALAGGMGIPRPAPGLAGRVRRVLLDLAVVPVLLLTAAVTALVLAGTPPAGPAAASFFAELGGRLSLLIPVGVLSLVLVGHALRERSAGYAFAAGLLVMAVATGGYALAVMGPGRGFGGAEWVRLLQLGTITAGAWALLWLASRRWVAAWREEPARPLARPLMAVQVALGVLGNAALLFAAAAVSIGVALEPEGPVTWPVEALAWMTEPGSPQGCLALGLTAAAAGAWRPRLLTGHGAGSLAFAAVILAACSVEGLSAGWGYRVLLEGWALCGLAWAVCGRRPTGVTVAAPPVAPQWVALLAVLVVALGIGAAGVHEDYLWAAAAIGTASTGVAVLAARWHRGDWALAAGLGFNLAASLVVWHFHAGQALDLWWVRLVQVNAAVSAAGALVWLALLPRLYAPVAPDRLPHGALSVQVGLGLLLNLVPLGTAFLLLYLWPGGPMALELTQGGQAAGWLALALAAAAVVGHVRRAAPAGLVHVLAGCGVLLAVLVAATAASWDAGGWLAYHVLLASLTGLATGLLAAGWVGSEASAGALGNVFPAAPTRRCVEGVGIVLVGLAVRGAAADPGAPYWPAGTVLAASALAGGLAFWSGRAHYVPLSGVLLFLAGVLAWVSWGRGQVVDFLYACVVCLGVASAVWCVLEGRLHRRATGPALPDDPVAVAGASAGAVSLIFGLVVLIVLFGRPALAFPVLPGPDGEVLAGLCVPAVLLVLVVLPRLAGAGAPPRPGEPAAERAGEAARIVPFSQAAGLLGLGLLAVLVVLGVGSDLAEDRIDLAGPLAWAAWGATLVAALARLWDVGAVGVGLRTLPPYLLGLLGIGLALHGLALAPADLLWGLTSALAAYVLAAALARWAVPRLTPLWQRQRLTTAAGRGPEAWLFVTQASLTAVVLALSVWVSFGFGGQHERLGGPLAAALLLAAWLVWARLRERGEADRPRSLTGLRYAVLLLGALVPAEAAWALPAPGEAGAWLHRNVLLFAALALTAAGYALGLRLLLPRQDGWATCGERLGPRLGLAALLAVLVVLGQEVALFDRALPGVPMAPWAVAVVALTLAGLATAAVCFAVAPRTDPLALPERRRPLNVYAAELVLVLLFVHVRLAMPYLFSGALAHYWTFVVMGLAFLGVGLAEWFERRGPRVLSGPLQRTGLFLPLLPLLAFWLQGLGEPLSHTAGARLPGLQPWLDYLRNRPRYFDQHALLWFLLGLLYAWVAVTRRSSRFALLAALAANFGLWALLYHYRGYGLGFLAHPQLWLIPLALIVLMAEHLNRDRLPAGQAAALRYFGLVLLYLSSTADLFLAGLGDVGLSLVLAVLSVLGVLAGIQLRVRAFLFLGLTFLVLVIFARIWYAAVTQAQTWVWWVALIVLGVAILALFAVFEKRRNDVLKLLEELKRWR